MKDTQYKCLMAKSNKFRFKIDTPWGKKGEIIEDNSMHIEYRNFPDIFDRLFIFNNGELLTINEPLFEIDSSRGLIETTVGEMYAKIEHQKKHSRHPISYTYFTSKETAEKTIDEGIKIINELFDKLQKPVKQTLIEEKEVSYILYGAK